MPLRMSRRNFTRGLSASVLAAAGIEGFDLACDKDEPVDQNATPFRHAASPVAAAMGVANPTALQNRISLNVYSFNIALNNYLQARTMGKGGCACDPLAGSLQAALGNFFDAAVMDGGYLPGQGGAPPYLDLLQFCKEQNIYALDATGYYWWKPYFDASPGYGYGYPDVPSDSDIAAFRAEAANLGIVISGTGIQNDFATPYSDQRESDLRIVRAWCEVAAKLGAPVLRVFAGPLRQGYGWNQVASWMVDCYGQCCEWGKEFGVKIGVQNHGDMLRNAEQCIQMLRMVDNEWFGLVNDTGYFLTPNPYADIAQCMPYTITFQIKESVRAVKNYQAAITDLERHFIPILANSSYPGWLPVETLQAVNDPCYNPQTEVPAFVKSLRAAMEGVTAGEFCPYCDPCADAGAGG
jgi:sugar phosphate isomerase/epimerase